MESYEDILESLKKLRSRLGKSNLSKSQLSHILEVLLDVLKILFLLQTAPKPSASTLPSITPSTKIKKQSPIEKLMEDHPKWCTVKEAAKACGRNKGVISRWAKEGIIYSNNISGHGRRIYLPDIFYIGYLKEKKDEKEDYNEYSEWAQGFKNDH